MKIAMIGTRGVPARYGGFETAVEEIGVRLAAQGQQVVVYCRYVGDRPSVYREMRLVHLPAVRRRSFETLSHSALSVAHVMFARCDCAVIFNSANAVFIPALHAAGVPVAVHVDGLEHRRGKWGQTGQTYYRFAERIAATKADGLIADSRAIVEYLADSYGRNAEFIAYGAPLVEPEPAVVRQVGLVPNRYHLAVARIEPENSMLEIIEGFSRSASPNPLVVVGDNPYETPYIRTVRRAAERDSRVIMLGSVWDQHLLDQLYANCRSYIHGHSVGGTNPSLLRAMGAGAPTIARDVIFNREVTGEAAAFFHGAVELAGAVDACEADPAGWRARGHTLRARAERFYRWDSVAERYAELVESLVRARRKVTA